MENRDHRRFTRPTADAHGAGAGWVGGREGES